jgi:hypothetical protein
MALGCGLTSVRGNRGKKYEKCAAGSPKTYKEKKIFSIYILYYTSVESYVFAHRATFSTVLYT